MNKKGKFGIALLFVLMPLALTSCAWLTDSRGSQVEKENQDDQGKQDNKDDQGEQDNKDDQGENGETNNDGEEGGKESHEGETFRVTYHLDGGTISNDWYDSSKIKVDANVVTQVVDWGDTLDLPEVEKAKHTFDGWFTSSDDINNQSKQWYTTDKVFADLDLYAKFTSTEPVLPTVKIGLQKNLDAGAGYSAISQGFFKDEGIDAQPTMGTGPALGISVANGELDVSYMGGGTAWYYFAENPRIQIVALDHLTDDDRLIATNTGKGKDLTISSSHSDLADALAGSKVALDLMTTPATFWASLVTTLDSELVEAKQIWWEDLDGVKQPKTLTNYAEDREVTIVNIANATIASTMQENECDFCVTYAPSATTLEKDTSNFTVVARTSTHMAESYTPKTWAVNKAWLADNQETFKKFMRGLVKGMNFRHDSPEKTCEDIEQVSCGIVLASSLDTDIGIWLNATQQLELLNSGKAMKYVENIRAAKQDHDGVDTSITAEAACDFSYLKEACEALVE